MHTRPFYINIKYEMKVEAKRIIFKGSVQGVGFRFTVFNVANRCRLKGHVCNMPDGSVEMVAQGHPDDVANCIHDINESFEDCITETKTEEVPTNPQYKEFKITF